MGSEVVAFVIVPHSELLLHCLHFRLGCMDPNCGHIDHRHPLAVPVGMIAVVEIDIAVVVMDELVAPAPPAVVQRD